ncbi:MAG: cupin domain-containing protein [Bryobacterales bacterium]|nr:cupin domain-containing protein [Bryobacterales bacterium]
MEAMVVKEILREAQFRPDKMGKADLIRGEMLSAGLNCFEPGQEHSAHVHAGQDKLYCVLQGEGELMIGAVTTSFREGDLALAPAGVEHGLRNTGPGRLVVMVVFAPPPGHR